MVHIRIMTISNGANHIFVLYFTNIYFLYIKLAE